MSTGQSLNDTLQERGSQYGNFSQMAHLAQRLKDALITPVMTDVEKESMQLICTKLARIACGNPHNRDSWHDIAGYANLVVFDLDRAEKVGYTTQTSPDPRADLRGRDDETRQLDTRTLRDTVTSYEGVIRR